MNVGSMRRAAPWVVVFLAAGAAISTSCASGSTASKKPYSSIASEHVVLLRSELQPDGKKKAIPTPDLLVVHCYDDPHDPDNPNAVVIWTYKHKSTQIEFKSSLIPRPHCDNEKKECLLVIPRGLTLKEKYKYKITGWHSLFTELEPNDPWIEVDR